MILNPFDLAIFNFHWSQSNQPAAAANLVLVAPVNSRAELAALSFSFVTDANAANRYLQIIVNHSTYPITIGQNEVPITASLTVLVSIGVGLASFVNTIDEVLTIPIVSFPFLTEGDTVSVGIVNAQVGDQIGVSRHCMKIWTYEQ